MWKSKILRLSSRRARIIKFFSKNICYENASLPLALKNTKSIKKNSKCPSSLTSGNLYDTGIIRKGKTTIRLLIGVTIWIYLGIERIDWILWHTKLLRTELSNEVKYEYKEEQLYDWIEEKIAIHVSFITYRILSFKFPLGAFCIKNK